jgi:hypothetical protein
MKSLLRCGLVFGLLALAPLPSLAQPPQSFQGLPLRINLDDRLRIEDQSGATTAGRLKSLTRDEITLQTDAGEKRFTSAAVREITVRRNTRRKGVLVGAVVGAAVVALAACWGPDRQECADAPILAGGAGAGVGWVVSALVPRSMTVYPSPIDVATSGGPTQPPGPFDDLALRVNLDDRLRVEERSGTRTTGRLTGLTGDEITIETDAGEKRFTSAAVREVAVRGYWLGRGALIGAGALTVLFATSPNCRSAGGDCVPIVAAPFGAGVGLAVGALIPRMRTVFRAQEPPRVSFSPAFSRGAIGVRATLRW